MSNCDETVYYVEKILNHKYVRGTRYFFIKWMGYGDSENSWEPEGNINDELVQNYDKSLGSEDSADKQFQPKSKKRKFSKKKRNKQFKASTNNAKATITKEVEDTVTPSIQNSDYVEPADENKDDTPVNYLENTKPLENVYFDDEINNESLLAGSLSSVVTEKIPEQANLESAEPKRRISYINGYSKLQFEDKKLRMLVKYEDEAKLKFVEHEIIKSDYPQELIDYYEKFTNWSDHDSYFNTDSSVQFFY